jgi:hypothetical protein
MNRPRRTRNRWLLVVALGPVGIAVASLLPEQHYVQFAPLAGIGGVMAIVFGLVGFLVAQTAARQQARLLDGREPVIGRWQVDPMTWQAFVAADRDRPQPGRRSNHLSIPRHPPQDAVEVIVGETALQVGDDFHSLRSPGYPAVQYAGIYLEPVRMIELGLRFPATPKSRPVETSLRFPMGVGANAEAMAAAVVQHYHTLEQRRYTPPLAQRNPALTWKISISLLILSAGTAGLGYLRWIRGTQDDLAVILAAGGGTAALGALIFLLIFALIRRK